MPSALAVGIACLVSVRILFSAPPSLMRSVRRMRFKHIHSCCGFIQLFAGRFSPSFPPIGLQLCEQVCRFVLHFQSFGIVHAAPCFEVRLPVLLCVYAGESEQFTRSPLSPNQTCERTMTR